MSEIYKICASAMVSLLAVLLLRQAAPSYGELAALLFGVCIIARAALDIAEIWRYLKDLAGTDIAEEHLSVLLKGAAIALGTDLTADICRDAGARSIASCVELFGRCELIMMSLPLIAELVELASTLLRL